MLGCQCTSARRVDREIGSFETLHSLSPKSDLPFYLSIARYARYTHEGGGFITLPGYHKYLSCMILSTSIIYDHVVESTREPRHTRSFRAGAARPPQPSLFSECVRGCACRLGLPNRCVGVQQLFLWAAACSRVHSACFRTDAVAIWHDQSWLRFLVEPQPGHAGSVASIRHA